MPDFLTLEGFTVPLNASPSVRHPRAKGRRRVSANGVLRAARFESVLRSWSCATVPMHYRDLFALTNLLLGNGHVWSFRNGSLTSSGGATHKRGNLDGVQVQFASGPFADTHRLHLASGASLTLRGSQFQRHTILVTRYTGSVWQKYAFLSDDVAYVAGVQSGAIGSYAWIERDRVTGEITLHGKNDAGTGASNYIAEVVRLPWRARPLMIAAWASKTTRWTGLPELNAAGHSFAESEIKVIGDVQDGSLVPAMINNEWSNTHGILKFSLHQVPGGL